MFRFEGLPLYIKRISLFLLVLIFAALQNTDGILPCIFGARFFVLIPLVIAIAMSEGEIAGLFYGFAAGAFWDVCSSGPDGFHAFYLAFAGAVTGTLVHFIMRNKLITQYCICFITVFVHAVLYWFVTIYIPVGDYRFGKLLGFYLPSAVITVASSFIVYYLVRLICTVTDKKVVKSL